MFIPDMPNVPPQNVPVMIAQANQAQGGSMTKERAFGQCYPVPSNYYGGENALSPLVAAKDYFTRYEPQTAFTGTATITVLQQPAHGVLRLVTEADRGILFSSGSRFDPTGQVYAYLPEKDYLGDDKASFLIERGGIKIKVVYFLKAVEGPLGNSGGAEYCDDTGSEWKISSTLDANGNSTISSIEYVSPASTTPDNTLTSDSLNAWLALAQLDAKVADMSGLMTSLNVGASTDSGITVNVTDLSGAAVGQTTGTSITLDTDAAGNGWFVDTTPADNSEFLPTADPNVWMAKADSAAAGKMDMLSVLLHEYGHALGIEHSADPNDFMNATLQPGEHQR